MLNKDFTRSVPISTQSSSAHVEERAVSTGVENALVLSLSAKIEDVKERLCCFMGQCHLPSGRLILCMKINHWQWKRLLTKRPDLGVLFNIRQFETVLVITRCRIGFLHYFASHAAQNCVFLAQKDCYKLWLTSAIREKLLRFLLFHISNSVWNHTRHSYEYD